MDLERVVHFRARGRPCRGQAEDQRSQHRDGGRIPRYAPIKGDGEGSAGPLSGLEQRMDRTGEKGPQTEPGGAPDDGQHPAFDQMLADETPAAGSQCQANGGLPPSLLRTREEQVGHIRTDDQQKDADQQHENP